MVANVKQMSVKAARSQFRKLLEEVASGDEVVLLRRGKEIARLVPPGRKAQAKLPSLRDFRASIRVKGRAISAEVVGERRRQRY